MSLVVLGEPPDLGDVAYTEYRPWLLEAFYFRFCSYCLVQSPMAIHIDHYEPRAYAPERIDDPKNLLLACAGCNGRGGKSDYHPLHEGRTRVPWDTSGHHVLDVRRDDLARMYEVLPSGEIRARPGPGEDRAVWNAVLLSLDLPSRQVVRGEYLKVLDAAEALLQTLDETTLDAGEKLLGTLVGFLARRRLFFEVFDVAMSDELRRRIAAVERGPV
jgi:hypothetical protein